MVRVKERVMAGASAFGGDMELAPVVAGGTAATSLRLTVGDDD